MEPNSSTTRKRIDGVPMMFENCKVLSPNYRVRWTVSADANSIDFGFEAATGSLARDKLVNLNGQRPLALSSVGPGDLKAF